MYCILVTGIPAAGKSTMAEVMAERLKLPVISKDTIKELLFDNVGFQSREEKVKLGIASMEIMYHTAAQLMKTGQPFILENNFEYSSEYGIKKLIEKYQYSALTITLTGDYKVIYQRFLERENSPDRHRGHVVNDCYPEKKEDAQKTSKAKTISYENFVHGIEQRGFDAFCVDGRQIKVDTTDFSKINMENIFSQIAAWKEEIIDMKDMIAKYRGNYIAEMRKIVGHAPLRTIGCGVIIENDKGEILLQKRRDNGLWALIGGSMEIGEKFIETVKREAFEEAGIEIKELALFGIYSGEDRIITYPNGDICCGTGIIFKTTAYSGEIQNNTEEALEHRFFDKTNLPDNINEYDKRIIIDWTKNFQHVIVD